MAFRVNHSGSLRRAGISLPPPPATWGFIVRLDRFRLILPEHFPFISPRFKLLDLSMCDGGSLLEPIEPNPSLLQVPVIPPTVFSILLRSPC